MHLHQRVGRLNRYGQSRPVEVVTVRNPHKVEARIWDKLEQKLGHIMQAPGTRHGRAKRIVGVGHQLFDRALTQAGEWAGTLALVKDLSSPLALFRFQDSLTGQTGQVRQVITGVTTRGADEMVLLRDEDVLALLNQLRRGTMDSERQSSPPMPSVISSWLSNARTFALATSDSLRLPFVIPLMSDLALLWPENALSGLGSERS